MAACRQQRHVKLTGHTAIADAATGSHVRGGVRKRPRLPKHLGRSL